MGLAGLPLRPSAYCRCRMPSPIHYLLLVGTLRINFSVYCQGIFAGESAVPPSGRASLPSLPFGNRADTDRPACCCCCCCCCCWPPKLGIPRIDCGAAPARPMVSSADTLDERLGKLGQGRGSCMCARRVLRLRAMTGECLAGGVLYVYDTLAVAAVWSFV